LEHGGVDRLLYLLRRCARVLLRDRLLVRAEAARCRQSLGCGCDHAGMDAAVAPAVPFIRDVAPDQMRYLCAKRRRPEVIPCAAFAFQIARGRSRALSE